MEKQALIAVSFGTSVGAAEQAIGQVEQALQAVCPQRAFFRAYSSSFLRKKLRAAGIIVPGPQELWEKLAAEGYEDIVISPTFLIPGVEYDRLARQVMDTCCSARLLLGRPLLQTAQDLMQVAEVLRTLFRRPQEPDTALLLMGHGTEHLANFLFPALQTAFRTLGDDRCYVATVEGWPRLADAMAQMKRDGVHRLVLVPFLLVAGDHVHNDMLGGEDSWQSVLQKEGFAVESLPRGLGEYPAVQKLYQQRLLETLSPGKELTR